MTERVRAGGSFQPAQAAQEYNVVAYPFYGYWEDIGTIKSFFEENLKLCRHVSDTTNRSGSSTCATQLICAASLVHSRAGERLEPTTHPRPLAPLARITSMSHESRVTSMTRIPAPARPLAELAARDVRVLRPPVAHLYLATRAAARHRAQQQDHGRHHCAGGQPTRLASLCF